MEKNPYWKELKDNELPVWEKKLSPLGCKPDGGGNHRGCGKISRMLIHRAANNKDMDAVLAAVEQHGSDVNEVEAAGNTALHFAAYGGWKQGVELLIALGAKVNASNNAGDRPIHWAKNMCQTEVVEVLLKHGALEEKGKVIVQDQVPKVRDFFKKECWSHHPLPYKDFIEFKRKEYAGWEAERAKLIPGL